MQQTKLYSKNYTALESGNQLFLPLNLEVCIPKDDSVRLLSHLLEGLNYEKLYKAYSTKGRKPAVKPKTFVKILIYAYMNNIYTTRDIELACQRDINFMWLLNGDTPPDHSTIARFRKHFLSNAAEDLFYQLIKVLHNCGEIEFENLFVDGTKIEANANRYTFVWKKVVNKNEEKMYAKILSLIDELNQVYGTCFEVAKETLLHDLDVIRDFLEEKRLAEKIEFVHGTGKRKTQLQKFMEQLQNFRERQEMYIAHNALFEGRNSFSNTDTDATFMHMKDDHMRNSQLKPAYNVQIAVEAEYIAGIGIFQDRNDTTTLIPLLENMKNKIGTKFKNIIADSGYESEENYFYLEKEGLESFIKPQSYDRNKKKSFRNDISKRENMIYNPKTDEYTCHNQKKLKPTGVAHKTSVTGFRSQVTIYECEDCMGCPLKIKCTKAQGNRKMQVAKNFIEKRQKSYENIITEKGIQLRVNRSIQVEGAFGILKSDYGFNRFLTRGKNNVRIEFILLCFGYNINKLHSKIQNERSKTPLHPIKQTA